MKKIYADTANLEEIKKLHSLNLIKGVTTNPSIISKEPKQNFNGLIENLWSFCADNDLSFSVEVFTVEVNEIINQAKNLFSELMNIRDKRNLLHIKVPIGVEEIKAVNEISNSELLAPSFSIDKLLAGEPVPIPTFPLSARVMFAESLTDLSADLISSTLSLLI